MPGLLEQIRHPKKEIIDRDSMIITMDGSSTAGKRIVSENLADRYGLTILNTGITIRSLALLAIENNLVETEETNVATIPVDFIQRMNELFDSQGNNLRIEKPIEGSRTARHMYGDRELLGELLTYPKQKAIENISSIIAASPEIRTKLYSCWRSTVRELGGAIVIGRKTGLDLFPDANIKLYLYASPEAAAIYRVLHDPKSQARKESEERYIRERDAIDEESGLLDRPTGGLIIDTSSYIKELHGLSALEKRIAGHIDAKLDIRNN